MPVSSAARALEVLLALSLLLQTLEYLRMRQALTVQGLWAWPVQRADIPPGPVQKLLDLLFADSAMQVHLLLRLPVLLLLAWQGSNLALALFLFASHVLMLIPNANGVHRVMTGEIAQMMRAEQLEDVYGVPFHAMRSEDRRFGWWRI